jgi:hypothetical protein
MQPQKGSAMIQHRSVRHVGFGLLVMTLGLFVLAGPARAQVGQLGEGERLMSESFDEGLGQWRDAGVGSIENGWYRLQGPKGDTVRVVAKKGADWTDYVVEFDVRIHRRQAGWLVRHSPRDEGGYYMFVLRPRSLHKYVIKGDARLHDEPTRFDEPLAMDETHHVRIEVMGGVIRHYVNGEHVNTFRNAQVERGTFGFRQCCREEASFDNVRIHKAVARSWSSDGERLMSAPGATEAPTIDGEIGENEWARAAQTTGYSNVSRALARRQTEAWGTWDRERLYLAFESRMDFRRDWPKKGRDKRDIFRNESIGVHLQPGVKDGRWFKLVFDPGTTQWDARYRGTRQDALKWDPEWRVATHRIHDDYFVKDTWQAEVAIPFASLPVSAPSVGETWGIQFTRNFGDLAELEIPVSQRWTSWTRAVNGDFNDPRGFGRVRFVAPGAGAFRTSGYGALREASAGLRGALIGDGGPFVAKMSAVRSADEQELASQQKKLDEAGAVEFGRGLGLEQVTPVTMRWSIVDQGAGRTIARGVTAAESHPAFSLTYIPLFNERKLFVEGDLSRMQDLPDQRTFAVTIRDDAGETLTRKRQPLGADATSFRVPVSLEGAEPGAYQVTSRLLDAGGEPTATSETTLDVPERPDWLGTDAGKITDAVPEPWEPVRIERDGDRLDVKTWAKNARFDGSMLPSAIEIRGEPFLSAPVRLVVVTDEGEQRFAWSLNGVEKDLPKGVTVRGEGQAGGLSASAKVRAAFDGLLWHELSVRPRGESARVRKMYLEIPLRSAGLRYMRACNALRFGKFKNYHAMIGEARMPETSPNPIDVKGWPFSRDGWKWPGAFANYYWIGGLDRGLFTVFKSPRRLRVNERYNRLIEGPKETVLRFNLADHPVTFEEETTYKFGLIPTPSKPIRDRNEMNRSGTNSVKKLQESYYREKLNIRPEKYFIGPELKVEKGDIYAQKIHGGITVNLGWAHPDQQKLRRIRNRARLSERLGIKAALWLDMGLGPVTTEYGKRYKYEWMLQPHNPDFEMQRGGHTFKLMSPTGSWPDYYLSGVKRLMNETGVEGVYLDMTGPVGATNPYLGNGYVEDGQRKPSLPFLAWRRLYLRLYNLVHTLDPDGIIMQHSMHYTTAPLWVDIDFSGEGWDKAKTYRQLSMPFYQNAFMAHKQYGTAFSWFASHNYSYYRSTPEEMSTLSEEVGQTLVHDTLPWPSTSPQIPGLVTVWDALEEFGAYDDETRWVPYWESGLGDWRNGLAVSYYERGDRYFVVAFNARFDNAKELTIDLREWGVSRVRNVLTGKARQTSTLEETIEPRDVRLLVIE